MYVIRSTRDGSYFRRYPKWQRRVHWQPDLQKATIYKRKSDITQSVDSQGLDWNAIEVVPVCISMLLGEEE